MNASPKLNNLIAKARGGRVVRTDFVEADQIDRRLLNDDDIKYRLSGGFADARRVVLTLFPAHIPEVDAGVSVLRLDFDTATLPDLQDVAVALKQLGLKEEQLGDMREQHEAILLAATGKALQTLRETSELGSWEITVEDIGEAAGKGSKSREVVVPSMRVDVVGAKGFGVSRAYFQQGIDGGKVRINGQTARASSEIGEGDSLSAEGLGRVDFKRVISQTRRGNFKVELEVHK